MLVAEVSHEAPQGPRESPSSRGAGPSDSSGATPDGRRRDEECPGGGLSAWPGRAVCRCPLVAARRRPRDPLLDAAVVTERRRAGKRDRWMAGKRRERLPSSSALSSMASYQPRDAGDIKRAGELPSHILGSVERMSRHRLLEQLPIESLCRDHECIRRTSERTDGDLGASLRLTSLQEAAEVRDASRKTREPCVNSDLEVLIRRNGNHSRIKYRHGRRNTRV